MSHSIEVVSELNRKVSVVISAEEVNAGLTAAAKEVGASVSIPGFRKGKVPASVIEKRFSQSYYFRRLGKRYKPRLGRYNVGRY